MRRSCVTEGSAVLATALTMGCPVFCLMGAAAVVRERDADPEAAHPFPKAGCTSDLTLGASGPQAAHPSPKAG